MVFQHVNAYFIALSCTDILPLLGQFIPAFADILNEEPNVSFIRTLKAALTLTGPPT